MFPPLPPHVPSPSGIKVFHSVSSPRSHFPFLSQPKHGLFNLQNSTVSVPVHLEFFPLACWQRVDLTRSWYNFIMGLWGTWSYLLCNQWINGFVYSYSLTFLCIDRHSITFYMHHSLLHTPLPKNFFLLHVHLFYITQILNFMCLLVFRSGLYL